MDWSISTSPPMSEEEKEAARWSLILENDLGLYAYDMSTLGYVSDKNGTVDTNLVGATVKTLFTDKKILKKLQEQYASKLKGKEKLVKELQQMGVSSICIKDMAGILSPKCAYDLVAAIKDAVDLPVVVHTHCTTGLAFMTYLKAIEAGADVIDTAISPFSGGTSQPATETLNFALKELGYESDLKDDKLLEIANFFKPVRAEFLADGTLNPISMATDTQCLTYQIPGGMLSNLLSQLKMLGQIDKFDEALLETPRVRKDMGYPPLVTPTSQLVGTQAVQNVLAGERYKNVGAEIKAYCRGEYGKTPAPIDPEIRSLILAGEEPIKGRYAESIAPEFEAAKEHLGADARCEEDVLSYIAFPQVAENFFEARREAEEKVCKYSIEPVKE